MRHVSIRHQVILTRALFLLTSYPPLASTCWSAAMVMPPRCAHCSTARRMSCGSPGRSRPPPAILEVLDLALDLA
ncbi:unnamed protein product [Arctogadus glacialis]